MIWVKSQATTCWNSFQLYNEHVSFRKFVKYRKFERKELKFCPLIQTPFSQEANSHMEPHSADWLLWLYFLNLSVFQGCFLKCFHNSVLNGRVIFRAVARQAYWLSPMISCLSISFWGQTEMVWECNRVWCGHQRGPSTFRWVPTPLTHTRATSQGKPPWLCSQVRLSRSLWKAIRD